MFLIIFLLIFIEILWQGIVADRECVHFFLSIFFVFLSYFFDFFVLFVTNWNFVFLDFFAFFYFYEVLWFLCRKFNCISQWGSSFFFARNFLDGNKSDRIHFLLVVLFVTNCAPFYENLWYLQLFNFFPMISPEFNCFW